MSHPSHTCIQSNKDKISKMIFITVMMILVLIVRNVDSFGGSWCRNTASTSSRRTIVVSNRNALERRNLGRGATVRMGLFDGIKEAFAAPALERSILDAERETPIDRWMGWSVRPDEANTSSAAADVNNKKFVDSMDEANYICASLTKPMGILFEENDANIGGIFVLSLTENSVAQGVVKPGLQLVAVNGLKVAGLPFEEALGAIKNSDQEKTLLTFFQGEAKQFYGPTGPSQAWLDDFIAKKNKSSSSTSVPAQ